MIYDGSKEMSMIYDGDKELIAVYDGEKEVWSNVKIIDLGVAKEWDIKALYPYLYKKLTVNNFLILKTNTAAANFGIRVDPGDDTDYWHINGQLYKSYDVETGKLNCYTRIYGNAGGTNSVRVIMYTKLDKLISLGTGQEFNVSNYSGYQNFTEDNFLISSAGGTDYYNSFRPWGGATYSGSGSASVGIYKEYNKSTGKLKCYLFHQQGNTDGTYNWFNFSAKANTTVYLRTEI